MQNIFEKKFTEEETAKLLGIARMTVRRRREDGSLGFYQMGKRILIGESHIEKFLEQTERNGKPKNEN
jgi:excisionase family DNA binding protein